MSLVFYKQMGNGSIALVLASSQDKLSFSFEQVNGTPF